MWQCRRGTLRLFAGETMAQCVRAPCPAPAAAAAGTPVFRECAVLRTSAPSPAPRAQQTGPLSLCEGEAQPGHSAAPLSPHKAPFRAVSCGAHFEIALCPQRPSALGVRMCRETLPTAERCPKGPRNLSPCISGGSPSAARSRPGRDRRCVV